MSEKVYTLDARLESTILYELQQLQEELSKVELVAEELLEKPRQIDF